MTQNYLNMSDEEMMSVLPPTAEVKEEPVQEKVAEEIIEDSVVVDTAVDEEEKEAEILEEEEEDKNILDIADTDVDALKEKKQEKIETVKETDIPPKKEEEVKVAEADLTTQIDYEAEYKKLLAPFKANGREITPKSVEDAISLMQMGANYNKKMAAIKPNLKLMKLLENNGLLDESKISFLIDLDKKSPEAITKLIKDSGINPMDIDTKKESEYIPKTRTVDDKELLLDSVLEEIQDTDTYSRTLDIVSKVWDGKSKQVVANAPELLRVINDHVSSGIYDIIVAEVDRERMFGRLNSLSDIEAYKTVGDAIEARGGFNHLNRTNVLTPPAQAVVVPLKSKDISDKLNDKRRAASTTKPTSPVTAKQEYNPLAMSDEEFNNISISR